MRRKKDISPYDLVGHRLEFVLHILQQRLHLEGIKVDHTAIIVFRAINRLPSLRRRCVTGDALHPLHRVRKTEDRKKKKEADHGLTYCVSSCMFLGSALLLIP